MARKRERALTPVWVESMATGKGRASLIRFATAAIHGERSQSDRDCVAMTESLLEGHRDPTTPLQRGLVGLWSLIEANAEGDAA
jgi:hypothetical protein